MKLCRSSNANGRLSILIIHPSKTRRGGIVNATLAHALGLQLRGHSVEVWTASQRLALLLRSYGISVFRHPAISSAIMLNLSRSVRARGRKLRNAGVDAVLHESAKSYAWSRFNLRYAVHAVVFHNRKLGGRRRFDNWFVLSQAHAVDLQSDPYWSDGKSVHVIRNGYVLDDQNGALNATSTDFSWGGASSYRIGVLCELNGRKGVDVLLKAAALAIAEGIPVELKVGGTGPEEAALRSLADELGIGESVRWHGWIDDREAFFREIDLYCLPSRSEPFGLVVIEAMATTTPVIASRTDGPVDIIAGGRNGWLFPVDDHESLCDRIRQVFDDPQSSARVAEQGKLDVEHRFRPEAAGETIETAFLSLLAPSVDRNSARR